MWPEDDLWFPDAHGVVRSFVCPAGAAARSAAEVGVRREGDMEGGGLEPCDGEAVVGHRGDEGGDDRVVGVPDRCWAQLGGVGRGQGRSEQDQIRARGDGRTAACATVRPPVRMAPADRLSVTTSPWKSSCRSSRSPITGGDSYDVDLVSPGKEALDTITAGAPDRTAARNGTRAECISV